MILHKHAQRAICQVILAFAKMTVDPDFHRVKTEENHRVRRNKGQKDYYANINSYVGSMLFLNISRLDNFPTFSCLGH